MVFVLQSVSRVVFGRKLNGSPQINEKQLRHQADPFSETHTENNILKVLL